MAADPIVPDTKDWTWAAHRRCDECGFDASQVSPSALAAVLRGLTAPWREVLTRADVTVRPQPATWSPLEYACHVHEVLDVFTGRFSLILDEDSPALPNWDQDRAAIEGEYAGQDPERIAREIPERTEGLIAVLGGYAGESEWERAAIRSDGAAFTGLSLARYLTHDLAHHLSDVGAGDQIPPPGSSRG